MLMEKANSEDPDQTAPVTPDLSVRKLGIITVSTFEPGFGFSIRLDTNWPEKFL